MFEKRPSSTTWTGAETNFTVHYIELYSLLTRNIKYNINDDNKFNLDFVQNLL